jgi:hypothetical protein
LRSFRYMLAAYILLYFAASIFFSIRLSLRSGLKCLTVLPAVFAAMHLSYGAGSTWALFARLLKS